MLRYSDDSHSGLMGTRGTTPDRANVGLLGSNPGGPRARQVLYPLCYLLLHPPRVAISIDISQSLGLWGPLGCCLDADLWAAV